MTQKNFYHMGNQAHDLIINCLTHISKKNKKQVRSYRDVIVVTNTVTMCSIKQMN